MHTSYRRSTYRARRYRGERILGRCLVYAGEDLLDKHLFVHRVSPGGFDWGPDADDDRACQLAIALRAPAFGLEVAVDDHHLFATNFVKCELTGDSCASDGGERGLVSASCPGIVTASVERTAVTDATSAHISVHPVKALDTVELDRVEVTPGRPSGAHRSADRS